MASYAVKAPQTGHFSVGGLLMAGTTGAASARPRPGLKSTQTGLPMT
jgi:hypothetical protein